MTDITINALPLASTIDSTLDFLPIYTASGAATQRINRNTLLGLNSAPVGLTDSQTLTNKILTSPTINGATLSGTLSGTYTLGGTPTFPSSVVTLTGNQTLTNKVLTSPTINSPIVTNATISADAIAGYSASTTGTIYGISVTTGTIGSAAIANNAILNAAIATGNLYASKFYNPYKFSVYRNAAFNVTNALAKVQFDTKNYDTSSNFDAVTNFRFTAPIAGFYHFNWVVGIPVAGTTDNVAAIYKNGTAWAWGSENTAGGSGGSLEIQAAANDYFEIFVIGNGTAAANVGNAPQKTWFSGFLESAT
jgi:hypothetical protein